VSVLQPIAAARGGRRNQNRWAAGRIGALGACASRSGVTSCASARHARARASVRNGDLRRHARGRYRQILSAACRQTRALQDGCSSARGC